MTDSRGKAWHLEPAGDWLEQAACSGMGPGLFFSEQQAAKDAAKRVCAGCDVRLECREYAVANDEAHGMWGGLEIGELRVEKHRRRVA